MATALRYSDIIIRPLMTEKSSRLQFLHPECAKYAFKVDPRANKCEVRKAVESLFRVKVQQVNVVKHPSKIKRFMGRPGRTRPWKKAVVTLRPGQRIENI
ncbi:MAG: 50S ribosomal protein L23 [Planctomycetota bacterium]